MTDLAIRVENLSKRYHIGELHQHHDTLRDALVDFLPRITRIARRKNHSSNSSNSWQREDAIWALKDVSFEVKRGEVVGIIGRNGAGKSTLLKILSRITEPTSGRVEMHGRVGSLLEVGTGFHPELTGRENIYLSGAILGLRKHEIDRKFDEIVDFSGIEKFIDTPVKRYSSGMYVRLAFAVAAHLDPEILLVDEVLAVGDAAFQKKCLGKMGDVAQEGRTVLFVSHNMAAVRKLCNRGILFNDGRVYQNGDVFSVIESYMQQLESNYLEQFISTSDPSTSKNIQLQSVKIYNTQNKRSSISSGDPVTIEFVISGWSSTTSCGFTIYDHLGQPIATFNTNRWSERDQFIDFELSPSLSCQIEQLLLVPGHYRVEVAIWSGGVLTQHIPAAAYFDVEQGTVNGRMSPPDGKWGATILPHIWYFPRSKNNE